MDGSANREITGLVQLCSQQPFSLEMIREYIRSHKMNGEVVTRAAIELCEEEGDAFGNFLYQYEREPLPQELVTYHWEQLFDVFIEYGLDPDLIITDKDGEKNNILLALSRVYGWNLSARITRNILRRGGTPNLEINGITVFEEVDFDLVQDIALGLYENQSDLDSAVWLWMVLTGFGGLVNGERCPVKMQNGCEVEIFKEFERFSYELRFPPNQEFDMYIYERETGVLVAIL